jgi:hypothetical protein
MSRSRIALALVLVMVSGLPVRAQRAESAPAAGEKFAIRTYEVGDLIINVPDYASPSGSEATGAGGVMGRSGGVGGGFFNVPDDADLGDRSHTLPSEPIVMTQMGGGGTGGGGMGGGMGMMPSGAASPAAASSDPLQIDFDTLIDAIVSVCSPNTWQENGGGEGDIKVVGAALVVRQTNAVHNEISDLLDQLRAGSARRRTVTIDARWLQLNSDELDQLLAGEDGKLSRETLNALTRRHTSLRAMTNCFSGQGVYLISGTRRNVVSGYIPVVGSIDRSTPEIAFTSLTSLTGEASVTFVEDQPYSERLDFHPTGPAGVGYQPVVDRPNLGAKLHIRPTIVQGESAAVVDLISTITFPGAANDPVEERLDGVRGSAPAIDRAAIDVQELATTLRVPLGEPTLVGGMSHLGADVIAPTEDAANVQDAREPRQLYLVLEVR